MLMGLLIRWGNIKNKQKMEETKKNDETAQLGIGCVNNHLYIWAIIENIVTIIVTAGLFWFTKSEWCFLFLLNLNIIKTTFKRK